MNHQCRHASERCFTAIKSAVLSEAALPERFENAFDLNLRHLRKDEFAEEIWNRVGRLRDALEGGSAMTRDEAAEGLKEMLAIYEDVAEAYYGPQLRS